MNKENVIYMVEYYSTMKKDPPPPPCICDNMEQPGEC